MSTAQNLIAKGEQLGLQKGEQLGLQKGKLEGKKERDLEIATKCLRRGYANSEIMEITDLSHTEIEAIRKQIAAA